MNSPYLTSLLNKSSGGPYEYQSYSNAVNPQPSIDDFAVPATESMVGSGGLVGKEERIAQIRKRLAEIAEEKKKYNMEEEIGKYKFLYDNDPSVLMNYKQNLRNAEQTEKIRKATEDATKASNAQNAYKQNAIDLEGAKYELAASKDAYKTAQANGNEEGMRKAYLDIQRSQAKLNRLNKENESLRTKYMRDLGITDEAVGDASEIAVDGYDLEGDVGRVTELKKLTGELDRLDKAYAVDNMPIAKDAKSAKVKQGLAEVARAEETVKASDIDESKKQEMLTKLADIRKNIVNFGKPSGKGGQGTTMTKEDYESALKGKNPTQIRAQGSKWLAAAKKAGVVGLDQYIKEAIAEGK